MINGQRRYQSLSIGWRILGFVFSLVFISWFGVSLFWFITDKLNLGILPSLNWSTPIPGGIETNVIKGLIFGWMGIVSLVLLLRKVGFKFHDD